MTAASEASLRLLEKQLAALRGRPWLPPELLRLVELTTRLQWEAGRTLKVPEPTEALLAAPDAHRRGAPLLSPEHFPYDKDNALGLWQALLESLHSLPGSLVEAARSLEEALSQKLLKPEEAFAAFLRDDRAFFEDWRERLPLAPALPRFLARAALTPSLAAASTFLAPRHATDDVWEHGHCPHCGHPPFIGQLRGKEGARRHTCSFCGTTWRAARLQCPFCLEKDTDKLRFFSADNAPGYQVHVCEQCKSYIKLADMREKGDTPSVPELDDLASLDLDILARRQGYARSTPSAWGF